MRRSGVLGNVASGCADGRREWLQVVTGEVDLAAGRDGMSVELQSFVSSAGWAKPQVHIGFRF